MYWNLALRGSRNWMGRGAAQEAALCAARSQAGPSQHLSSLRTSHTASLSPPFVIARVPRASALPASPHVWTSALHGDSRTSFSTDTAWPQVFRTIFDIFRQQGKTIEVRYYGPYTKLLHYCFGNSFQYIIQLQSLPSDLNLPDTVDFEEFMVVYNVNSTFRPVLIVQIKDDVWAHRADLRFKADDQIRRRYDAMLGDCPLPRLWGLSLFGTSLRVYCGTVATGVMKPNFVPRPDPGRILAPDFLEGAWDIDILSQEGFNKMKEIITDVLAAAPALY